MEHESTVNIGNWNSISSSPCGDLTFSKIGTMISSPKMPRTEQEGRDPCPQDNVNEMSANEKGDTTVGSVTIFDVPIVCLFIENRERLCLAQISNTLLRDFSYNEIHNRRVALGITCLQCTPVQLEVLRRTGAMPISSRRCGLITKREAERLVKSFLEEIPPPKLPENFSFKVSHECGWGCQGLFIPSKYNSSRAKCIKCSFCNSFFSPNKFIFHHHKANGSMYKHPDAANFNSWRRHLHLIENNASETLQHTWEDVKAMFNGGCRKRTTPTPSTKTDMSNLLLKKSPAAAAAAAAVMSNKALQPSVNPVNRFIEPSLLDSEYTEKMHAHPAFPTPYHAGTVGPYGDILRSLSMHYSPWWKSMCFPSQHYNPYNNSMPLPPVVNYNNMVKHPTDMQQIKDATLANDGVLVPSQQAFTPLGDIFQNTTKAKMNEITERMITEVSNNGRRKCVREKAYETNEGSKICTDIDELIDIDSNDIVETSESLLTTHSEQDRTQYSAAKQTTAYFHQECNTIKNMKKEGSEIVGPTLNTTGQNDYKQVKDGNCELLDFVNGDSSSFSADEMRSMLLKARTFRLKSKKKLNGLEVSFGKYNGNDKSEKE